MSSNIIVNHGTQQHTDDSADSSVTDVNYRLSIGTAGHAIRPILPIIC